ncbi:1-acyl-sn-glycerol-3-phosphate acyltransferase alpha [Octopus bimaculoides]|uniref:1-acyl-sn-glycerol-3-phosphate acyltransferase n=1 Tax=Octopus bimaculoides TaxID=37653 RepID=A0A0L8G778_OCTBM|nr:1-acyl-sn-glycerol-3-phosphate acyltransferase alpha [Octopus bimaculoides]|eukprot:XP_014783591.1 PREDICTED: 1-acyl-sn-glycerol-3-phosphate acyltransferase alpha-like [Octopus bimaculoides]
MGFWDIIFWIFLLVLLTIPVLYSFSGHFRYYVKIGIYYFIVLFLATVVCLVAWVRPFHVNNHKILKYTFWCVKYILGIDVETRGKKNLEVVKGPYIITCNHQSSLDFIGMMEIWPDYCTSLAKKELLYTGVFGVAAWLCGTIFIDRLNHEKALKTLVDTAEIITKKQIRLFTFPEGTRNRDGRMLPFKKGVFHLAVQSQVPIVPVIFSSFQPFYSKNEKKLEPGKFIITILPPTPTTGLKSTDVNDLCEKLQIQMENVYYKTSHEVSPIVFGSSNTSKEKRPLSVSPSSLTDSGGLGVLERIEEESVETNVETISPDVSTKEEQKLHADRIRETTVAEAHVTMGKINKSKQTENTEELAQKIVAKTVKEAQELVKANSFKEAEK